MFHCCTLRGSRRIETPQAYIAVLPERYIQVLLAKKLPLQRETRNFEGRAIGIMARFNIFPK
jgi:hypothetical protein